LWKGAALVAMALSLAAAIVHGALGYWGGSIWLWLALPTWAGAAIGYLLPLLVRPLHRALVGADSLDSRVDRRAQAAFAESEVFATRARTGLLLLIALFEHRVEIVSDKGVEARVPSAEWTPIIDRLTAGLRQGRTAQSIVAAIGDIGSLLELRGVTSVTPDIDELPDRPTWSKE
jgi:putative membrane protein